MIFSPRLALGTPENARRCSISALFRAPEKEGVRPSHLILFTFNFF